jgi:hypothetical protein
MTIAVAGVLGGDVQCFLGSQHANAPENVEGGVGGAGSRQNNKGWGSRCLGPEHLRSSTLRRGDHQRCCDSMPPRVPVEREMNHFLQFIFWDWNLFGGGEILSRAFFLMTPFFLESSRSSLTLSSSPELLPHHGDALDAKFCANSTTAKLSI